MPLKSASRASSSRCKAVSPLSSREAGAKSAPGASAAAAAIRRATFRASTGSRANPR